MKWAPGIDILQPEVFKQDHNTRANILHPIFGEVWVIEKVPKEKWPAGETTK